MLMRIEGARGLMAALGMLSAVACGVNHDCARTATCAPPPERDGAVSDSEDAGVSGGSAIDGSGSLGSTTLSDATQSSGDRSDSDPQGIELPLPPIDGADGGSDDAVELDGGGSDVSFGDEGDASAPVVPDVTGPYEVGGSVEGLTGELTLLVGGEEVELNSDGPFSVGGFAAGDAYEVTVISQPVGQRCDVANGEGTIAGATVDDVVVDCLGDVATLAELSISPKELSPEFTSTTFAYEVELSLVSQMLQVRATASDGAAFVVVNQASADPGVPLSLPLQVGENTISITVTAPSGRTESYTVAATRTELLPEPRLLGMPAGTIFAEPFIASHGETLVVYTKETNESGPLMVLYRRVNGQWAYATNLEDLVPDDISRVDQVTVCERWLVVTAALSDELDAERVGYVFSNITGYWVFDSVLPSEWEFPDFETAAASACDGDTILTYPGSLGYTSDIYEREGAAWVRGNIATGAEFTIRQGQVAAGYYVDNTAAVGVNGDEVPTCPAPANCMQESGAVRLFEKEGQEWAQTVFLKPQNPEPAGLFGRHVVLFGQYLVVGFPGDSCAFRGVTDTPPAETCSGAERSGSIYVYDRGLGWSNATYIKAEGVTGDAIFGIGIWGHGDLMFVGAPNQEPHSDVYVFLQDGTEWRQIPERLLIPELPDGGYYPLSAVLDGAGFYAADHDVGGGKVYRYED